MWKVEMEYSTRSLSAESASRPSEIRCNGLYDQQFHSYSFPPHLLALSALVDLVRPPYKPPPNSIEVEDLHRQ